MSDVCSSCSLYARCRCAGTFSPVVAAVVPPASAATGGTVRGPRVVPPVPVGHTNRSEGLTSGTRSGLPSTPPVLYELRSGRRWRKALRSLGRVLDSVRGDR